MGQFKTPFTREFITSPADLETADRSTVVDSLAPRRDIGVMADRDAVPIDDKGWYALAAHRIVPWIQVVVKQEDFRRSAISPDSRNRATTGGVNVEFNGGKVRWTANYISRKIGIPGTRRGTLLAQAQVRF